MDNAQYMFIRGARIASLLNEDSTYDDLETNIVTNFPATKKRQHATNSVRIQTIDIIPYVGTKMLHVRAYTAGSSGKQYQQAIQFLDVSFESTASEDTVEVVDTSGRTYNMRPIVLSDHNAKVRCNCLDFYHRFAHYNHRDRSLVGRAPIPYQRKTTTWPEVNPNHVPGLCKHLLKVVQDLQRRGIII